LSFKEQRELDGLPARIESLEREQHHLTARMSAPDYHREGGDAIKADRLRVTALEHELAANFERWAALEERARAAAQSTA
jgi:ATP-binding cassette subfamily F protein uup